jgi:hypothetical protein
MTSPDTEVMNVPDIRFDSLEDGELADIWYALGGAAVRHPDHFQPLMEAVFDELLERRGDGLNPWLEQRFRAFRLADSKEDAEANELTGDSGGAGARPVPTDIT